jgi:hypothetical protein
VPLKDEAIFQLVEKIRDHYHNNINNRFIRKALLMVRVPREIWDALSRLTEETDYHRIQGYHYKELYEQIHAAATFVYHAKSEVQPNLKTFLAAGTDTVFSRSKDSAGSENILRNMAINNFPANLGIFTDMINELYVRTVAMDREDHPGEKPIFERMPELKELGKLLT